ncbi:hypothetical protein D3C78_1580340 [compost metagenome]
MHARSGNHQGAVTGLVMAGDGGAGVAVDQRLDHILDVGLDLAFDFLDAAPAQRLQAEGHVVLHRQLAVAVQRHQFGVAADEGLGIHPAQVTHAPAPQAGAIAGDQGFVEIENYQGHQVTSRMLSLSICSPSRLPAG